jgi:hypothetical protein
VRQSAGLLLKNNVRRDWKTLNPAVQAYVKARRSAPPRLLLAQLTPHHRKACCRAWASRSATCASPSAPPSGALPLPPPSHGVLSPNTLLWRQRHRRRRRLEGLAGAGRRAGAGAGLR